MKNFLKNKTILDKSKAECAPLRRNSTLGVGMKKIRNVWWMFIVGVFGMSASVFADGGGSAISLPNPLSCGDTGCVVTKIINFIFMLATPICAIMVLWGGFEMMTAAGDPEKFSTGRNTILYAAIGFVVVLLANSATSIIGSIFQ
jgi:hypothetical protein